MARVQNALADMEVEVITDQDAPVHVSGHPRRGELEQLYGWVKPQHAIPMHGEGRHLEAHAKLAERLGVKHVVRARNGDHGAAPAGARRRSSTTCRSGGSTATA